MSEEFILKACKSSRRHVDTIIEKKINKKNKRQPYLVNLLFFVYLLKLELILFYNRVVYYHMRIFLILLPHPV